MAQESLRDLKRQATRTRLVDAARDLFAARGYTATGADLIAREAGVSRATFYLHFRSKADLVTEVMRAIEPQITGAYRLLDGILVGGGDTMAAVLDWFDAHLLFWDEHGSEFDAIQQALTHEPATGQEWFAMLRRTAGAMTSVTRRIGDPVRAEARILVQLMAVERTHSFQRLVGGPDEPLWSDMRHALARGWVELVDGR
ncbi:MULTISPECIES: TetR/AcrR family transcriptional regulator [Nocardiopsis]|uniref:AcrR family transcriptional regulator n=1 Tax=Nocardiopsis sinuspersici TaxID=501010 RepID=A0A7Z0BJ51_9ACTN|nr:MULTISPECIES: TetR/AcrR family transcriptional regulator [Nocardiopsis]NYH51047.1 AcrR family transcriptional regulator [Nocardiopsis sinuspersici]